MVCPISKPVIAAYAVTVGVIIGVASQALYPNHFARLAELAGPPLSTDYRRCLQAKGYGHDLDPLTLQEFCGVWVSSVFLQAKSGD
jgi:hypothetical protein